MFVVMFSSFFLSLRGNWEQAENGLNSVLDSLVEEGWSQLTCSMLVFLAYVQNKREEYSDYISTCLRLLSYENFDRKYEFSSALIDIASNKLPESISIIILRHSFFYIRVRIYSGNKRDWGR